VRAAGDASITFWILSGSPAADTCTPAKIPDSKLNPILDQAQLTFVKKVTAQGRGMEARLRQMGFNPSF